MDVAAVNQLIEYYKDLLIIQYAQKPRARSLIGALVGEVVASGIIFDVRDAYDVETAVGAQLDIIGKYVGIDRFFNITDPIDYFALTDYVEVDPDADEKHGFTTYDDFDDFQFNGTLNYNSIITTENRLNDDDFRTLIKLKIIQNHSNHSHKSIDDSVFEFFDESVVPSSDGDMKMYYFVGSRLNDVARAALVKNVLPKPMGVGLGVVEKEEGVPYFGYTSYADVQSGILSALATGYTTYADYATDVGGFLSYRNME